MIIIGPLVASEHTALPEHLKHSSEKQEVFCTYTWVYVDEIEEEFPIAVLDYKPKRSKRTQYVFSEPIWQFIADERTAAQQHVIDKNIDKLNNLWVDILKSTKR